MALAADRIERLSQRLKQKYVGEFLDGWILDRSDVPVQHGEQMMADKLDNRSLGDLFAELSRETGQLVRKEVELATTEMTAKVKKAGAHVGIAAAGGALVHAGLLVLLAAIVIGLSAVVEPWLSALIVGVVTMIVGYVLVNRGLAGLRATRMVPTQTIETLKEDARWTTRQGA